MGENSDAGSCLNLRELLRQFQNYDVSLVDVKRQYPVNITTGRSAIEGLVGSCNESGVKCGLIRGCFIRSVISGSGGYGSLRHVHPHFNLTVGSVVCRVVRYISDGVLIP